MYRLLSLLVFNVLFVFSLTSLARAGDVHGHVDPGVEPDNVVIYLTPVEGKIEYDKIPGGVIDQINKEYVPHVLPIMVGGTMTFLNSDGILHNVHLYHETKTVFNIAMPAFKKKMSKTLDKAGEYVLLCDAHSEMSAYILVLESPFFAKPNAKGNFVINGIPAGTYNIVRYIPEQENVTKTVEIPADGEVVFNF